jgi:hypothetical protein
MRKPFRRWWALLRGRRGWLWLALALIATAPMSGCRHGRSALRPAFSGTRILAPRAEPCPSGDCGGTVIQTTPGYSDPADLTAPLPLGGETINGSRSVSPAPSSPPSNDNLGDEPILEPATPGYEENGNSRGSLRPRDESGPNLEGPASTRANPALRRSNVRARPATLRRDVQAYVNDPADLFTPPRADRPWRYIVLHHSAHSQGSLRQIDRDHKERLGTSGCGYHFVVGNGTDSPDGQIEVASRWSDQKPGQHCRDSRVARINDDGIGICLIGNFDEAPPTGQQVEATRALIAYLADRYQIPPGNIVTHDVVAQTRTACPGQHFPYQALLGRDRTLARAR